jgi:hypothetical protein
VRLGGRGSRISHLQRLQRIDEAGAKTVVAVTRREPFGAQGEEVGGALAEFGKPFRNLIKIGFVLRLTTAGIIFFYHRSRTARSQRTAGAAFVAVQLTQFWQHPSTASVER